ncbi:MAG: hypothetical protein ACI3W8_05670 [Oscillospiraceae bacterium]
MGGVYGSVPALRTKESAEGRKAKKFRKKALTAWTGYANIYLTCEKGLSFCALFSLSALREEIPLI